MGYISHIVLCVAALFTAADDRESLTLWLTELAARGPERPANVVYEFDIAYPSQLSSSELALLGARVRGHPDHPELSVYEAESRRAKSGPDIKPNVLYWREEGAWRLNVGYGDGFDPAIRFVDTCVRPDRAWRLIPEQLTLIDPASGYPADRNYAANEATFLRDVDAILDGGMRRRLPGAAVKAASAEGDRWNASFVIDGREFEYSGTLVRGQTGGVRFQPHRFKILTHADPEFIGQHELYEQWRWDEILGQSVATHVTFVRPSGTIDHEVMLKSIRRLGDDEFDRVTAIPEVGSTEPIRGDLRITRVFDLRPAAMEVRFPQDSTRAAMPLSTGAREDGIMRVIGWCAAATIVGILAWLRVRRKLS
ncbi:MAG: hypothetical protein GIKADHBN_01243 [Phycisphaerales bacterium]|nr:hypothetical protein [Phycisphaerales bacterium]